MAHPNARRLLYKYKCEEDDWKKFYDTSEDNKDLLEELQPETVKNILERKIKSKEQLIKKTVKKKGR